MKVDRLRRATKRGEFSSAAWEFDCAKLETIRSQYEIPEQKHSHVYDIVTLYSFQSPKKLYYNKV